MSTYYAGIFLGLILFLWKILVTLPSSRDSSGFSELLLNLTFWPLSASVKVYPRY
jgi:hypothetical protein